MDDSRLTARRLLLPVLPLLLCLVLPNLVNVGGATRREVRTTTVTIKVDGEQTRTITTRGPVAVVDLDWSWGPVTLSRETVTASYLGAQTKATRLSDGVAVRLADARARFALWLFPVALLMFLVLSRKLQWHSRIAIDGLPKWSTPKTLVATACIILSGAVLLRILQPQFESQHVGLALWYRRSAFASSATMAYFFLVAPITEELVFRAGLLRLLTRRASPSLAVVVHAAIFGALHLATPLHAVVGMTGGIVFGTLYVVTRNLAVPILGHILANASFAVAVLV